MGEEERERGVKCGGGVKWGREMREGRGEGRGSGVKCWGGSLHRWPTTPGPRLERSIDPTLQAADASGPAAREGLGSGVCCVGGRSPRARCLSVT